ncbi:glycosyltransferase family 2 protein [Methylorubrum salsuginis]|uniref:Glycosyltransferase, catalytic subunit of cellulose synthase and poly-beta-1,6-N-acetylglucosamine synthase n=1 Tax=Methylorubrum salsuginis TaxID=414703 RepID=A0A1I4LRH5_9HYPH|nr:glycosyltransferase family 2 protein [Methylorubrum salsuginis]SFL93413.1 Glycosyltransferase, catalytic subunit of cellulose synthase and poly-beta-1,6-N-acetylglucosamine synthase [Methylorubrum salsuginis]
MSAISLLLLVAGCLLAVSGAVFCGEIAAALLIGRRPGIEAPPAAVRARLAVVVPAHDEERHLAATLRSVRAQLREGDRVVVVADNCTDGTAAIAAEAGAEVVVRTDAAKCGKGYALDAGIRFLERAPPEIVVFVDADCQLGPGTLDVLAATAGATARPTQACYLILAGAGGRRDTTVAAFAQVVKNRIRPLGLQALGLPCQLAGSGMAFPWPLIATLELASGDIVEDLTLGLACAAAGRAPVYCAEALVVSEFPTSRQAAALQRQRWQQGHLRLMAGALAPLLTGLIRRDRHLVALVLDLMVPPLTLLLAADMILATFGAGLVLAGGSGVPLTIGLVSLLGVTGAIVTAWLSERESLVPTRPVALLSYVASGLALTPRLLSTRPRHWIRTHRGDEP